MCLTSSEGEKDLKKSVESFMCRGVANKYLARGGRTEVFLSKPEAAGLIESVVLEICFAGSCESGALPGERGEPVPVRLGVHEIHSNHY